MVVTIIITIISKTNPSKLDFIGFQTSTSPSTSAPTNDCNTPPSIFTDDSPISSHQPRSLFNLQSTPLPLFQYSPPSSTAQSRPHSTYGRVGITTTRFFSSFSKTVLRSAPLPSSQDVSASRPVSLPSTPNHPTYILSISQSNSFSVEIFDLDSISNAQGADKRISRIFVVGCWRRGKELGWKWQCWCL